MVEAAVEHEEDAIPGHRANGARRTEPIGAGWASHHVVTLADAFAEPAHLPPAGRAALAKALGCRSSAVGSAPLGDLRDRRHRQLLRGALESAFREAAVAALADTRLTDLFPAAALVPDEEIGAHQCSAKAHGALARASATRWSTLLSLGVAQVRAWPHAGSTVTVEILGLAFERSLAGLASTQPNAEPAAIDLTILLDHEQLASRRPLQDALLELTGDAHPATVRDAAARLLRTTPHAAGLDVVLRDILAAAGSPRDLDVLTARSLRLENRPTMDEVAARLGMSNEGVRQVRLRAEERMRAGFAAAPERFRSMVLAVRQWLGELVPLPVADDLARRLGAGSLRSPAGALLLWLGGPYLPVPGRGGWLATDPSGIVAATTEWLAQDGGVRPVDEVRGELAGHGVRTEHRDAWLAASGAVVVDDMVVWTSGGPATVAERVLFATGRAMTAEEIAGCAVRRQPGELRDALRRDRRFVCVAPGVYELVDWGGSPAPPAQEPTGELRWLRVRVDDEVLRGSGRPAPVELVEAVGLAPSQRRTFASRYGPVTLVHEGPEPTLGSLRHVALACGARPGDELWLGFGGTGDVAVRLPGSLEQPDGRIFATRGGP